MSQQYFAKINTPLKEYQEIYESILKKDLDGIINWTTVEDFEMVQLPNSVIDKNTSLKTIFDKFEFAPVVIKMRKNTIYNWHRDAYRGTVLNLLLNNQENSHCIFQKSKLNDNNDEIIELKYDPGYFYLFNTQERHQVINFKNDRYLLSCTFLKKKELLSYKEVLDFCLEEKIIDQVFSFYNN